MTKPWFVRSVRRSGGFSVRVSPYAWQGWVASLVFVAAIIAVTVFVGPWMYERMPQVLSIVVIVGVIVALVIGFIAFAWSMSKPVESIDRN